MVWRAEARLVIGLRLPVKRSDLKWALEVRARAEVLATEGQGTCLSMSRAFDAADEAAMTSNGQTQAGRL